MDTGWINIGWNVGIASPGYKYRVLTKEKRERRYTNGTRARARFTLENKGAPLE